MMRCARGVLGLGVVGLVWLAACSDEAKESGDNNATPQECPFGEVRIGGDCRPIATNNSDNNSNNSDNNNSNSNNNSNNSNNANNSNSGNNANSGNNTNNPDNSGNNPDNSGNNPDNNGNNGDGPCVQGQSRCLDEDSLERCNAQGQWQPEDCPDDLRCDRGTCRMRSCEPGEVVGCYEGGYQLAVCNEQGTGTDPRPCEGGLRCRDGECSDRVCDEGERRCNGETLVTACNADGTDFVELEECPAGTGCDEGECKSLCELNSKVTSYLGCEYWVVDLDNIDDQSAGDPPSAITVSNPNPSLSAEVTVTQVDGSPVLSFMVGPNALEVRELPTGQDLDGTGLYRNNAFHVETSLPVTMHQFNPLNGEGVFTNDASLLLPVNAGGREYLVMAWKHRGNALESLSGYATVVALEEGETRVTVTPTAAVAAGSGVPGLRANTPWEAVLQRGEVLSLNTSGPEGADLTGTSILADRNIAVFGGHQCANIPTPSTNYCDHVESQLFPLSSWGTEHIGTPFSPRNDRQQDTWVLLSGEASNQITTNPPTLPVHGLSMRRGQSVSFQTNQPFELTSTGPVMLGQFMHGSNYAGFSRDNRCGGGIGGTGIGDPAFTLAVPTEQFRADYIVLTPTGYTENYLNIIAPRGANVMLDGRPVSGLTAIGNTGVEFVQLAVTEGVHRLQGAQPFGLVAYGYDCDVSYAYPGGLNLTARGAR